MVGDIDVDLEIPDLSEEDGPAFLVVTRKLGAIDARGVAIARLGQGRQLLMLLPLVRNTQRGSVLFCSCMAKPLGGTLLNLTPLTQLGVRIVLR